MRIVHAALLAIATVLVVPASVLAVPAASPEPTGTDGKILNHSVHVKVNQNN
ncbi:hypothetical protein BD309DRAFT_1077496 [Dichomitus squalens]|uniref:Uncharacterized protein n=2 Tax=Dichomitus squalens TaxID=114155 RepID=A0A4Q9P5T1_9APHY|nr:uncharacterized protein DICSQDRAFT_171990 [Dichomitus squalens LYAD-421 SS1]EJF59595.1 hypothetical protein DICSQDRAFT_171990 [Dichomitus squalens LYAD-421 SS1]TBU32485.1 hypothetical protein BD311DRAFT_862459 [Dichomitus squalens]TBU48051.1 hypothetical protein BD309DRAFT_1077496 [Dichomitus squalens]TBU59397.1 hypothetical protein BD310DRAFT_976607 [Dichomitus squalens]